MPKVLSEREVQAFHERGFHAPVRVMSASQARDYRSRLERFEARWPDDVIKLDQGAALLVPWIDELVRLPAMLDPIEDVLGPNILCWGTSLRAKPADGKTFAGWHQDTAYCDIRPIVVIAILALSECSKAAGCARVIPGSHKWDLMPHTEHFGTASLLTREQSIEAPLDTSSAVDLALQPGEMAFFNNAICHSSGPNLSRDRRILMLVEYVPTHAFQQAPRESAMLVRGVDEHGHFDTDPRPETEMGAAELDAWRKKVAVQAETLYRGAQHPARALQDGGSIGD